MNIAFARPDLHTLDELSGDAIALSVFEDERPFRRLAGLVDWRLNGRLSRIAASGRFLGGSGEALLYAPRGRVSFPRLLLFGLGPMSGYDEERYRRMTTRLLRVLRDLGARQFAAALPNFGAAGLNPRQAVDIWLQNLRDVFLDEPRTPLALDIRIVEDPEVQRAVADHVSVFLRRLSHNRGTAPGAAA